MLANPRQSPGEQFNSLTTVLTDLQDSNIPLPSSDQLRDFKEKIYMKYLDALIQHLTNRFPDIHLLEAFPMFNGKTWPINDQTLLQEFGNKNLNTLTEHFSPISSTN